VANVGHPLRFAAVLAGLLGVVVAGAAAGLSPRIAHNAELERRQHVLSAAGIATTRAQVDASYRERISEDVVMLGGVERVVYVVRGMDDTAFIVPVEGPGLWGPIRGYLALDPMATVVRGVTFYSHRETPGLGAQIAEPRWAARWRGKSIRDRRGVLAGVRIVRDARAADPYAVDAITGATLTSRAVETLVRTSLEAYRPYLEARWIR
jgi:Na+-transporting NADH:ubiquinone oxidoreductase subunit C